MFEHSAMNEEFRDVEELVRAAGSYLDVSDDLRPQTLEAAHSRIRKRSDRFRFAMAATTLFVLSMGILLASTQPFVAGLNVDSSELYETASKISAETNVEPSGSLVDAFSELRQRDANVIKGAF